MLRPTAPVRVLALAVVTALAAVLLVATGLAPASAHTRLVGSVPAAGAEVPTAPDAVELQFNEPVQALGTQLRVTGPEGEVALDEAVVVDGAVVRQPLPSDLPAGPYTVLYRVVSGDGHPVEGELVFTAAATAASPTTTATTRDSPSASAVVTPTPAETRIADRNDTGGLPSRVYVFVALALVAGVALAVRLVRRGRGGREDDAA